MRGAIVRMEIFVATLMARGALQLTVAALYSYVWVMRSASLPKRAALLLERRRIPLKVSLVSSKRRTNVG